jgi:hypothetical protein
MPRLPTMTPRQIWLSVAVAAAGAVAALLTAWSAIAVRPPEPKPTEVVAARFPTKWDGVAAAPAPDAGAIFALANAPDSPLTAGVTYPSSSSEPNGRPTQPLEQAGSGVDRHSATAGRIPVPRRAPGPPGAVFNNAQIASIKSRLNLTRGQERHWPEVEAALRALVWQRPGQRNGEPATLDMTRVQRLQAAVAPLVETLDNEQRRELQSLAHIIGLGRIAAQY